jgi:hypothetical protein
MRLSLFAVGLCLLLVSVAPAADSLNVRAIGSCDAPGYALDVSVSGDHAYVTDGDSGLRVISIADPAHPVQVGRYIASNFVYTVVVVDRYAYLGGGDNGLIVLSVEDPSHPTWVGSCPTDWALILTSKGTSPVLRTTRVG